MNCSKCNTSFEVVPIEIGKSKFCRNCGNVIYKNENGTIIYNQSQQQNDVDSERKKNEELLRQRQLEIEKQRNAEIEKQRQLEIQKENDAKAEKLRLEEIEKQKTLSIERQRQEELLRQQKIENEKKHLEELERQRILDIHRQKEIEVEKLRSEELNKQQTLELAEQQNIVLKKQIEQQRLEKEQLEKALKEKEQKLNEAYELALAKEKTETVDIDAEYSEVKTPILKYILILLTILAIAAAAYYFYTYYYLPKKGNTQTISKVTKEETTPTIAIDEDEIKLDLVGKNITGWNNIQLNQIASIKTTPENRNDSIIYKTFLELISNNTKAKAEIEQNFSESTLSGLKTKKITYQNTAPLNAWYSFSPIPDCNIIINTNNNPIQLKTCENCPVQKINTNADTQNTLDTHPDKIFISSDNKFESVVDFTYIPEN